jgi:hypothetical protein
VHYILMWRERKASVEAFLGFGRGGFGGGMRGSRDWRMCSCSLPCFATDGTIGLFKRRFEELVSS